MRPVATRRTHVAEKMPRTRRRDAALHALLRHLDEPLRRRRHLADEIHPRGIRIVAVHDDGRVDVDDVPLFEHILGRRNPVADHVVDRRADALGEALKAEAGGNAAV